MLTIPSTQQLTHPIPQILPHHNYAKPIKLTEHNPIIHLHIYIILTYPVKISQLPTNLQSTLKYTLQKTLNLKLNSINIFLQALPLNDTLKKLYQHNLK
ncbi:Asp23/Gls24 family envelope stress response protein, partial [Staphylococcus epidermidis]|uniref:Asp23/Gls24 family envelope stress response protein n=1 Tax=Staphylococcus epidermidis TaxID=1282 RepID=UPI0037D9DB3D